jgi:hypothetical protein
MLVVLLSSCLWRYILENERVLAVHLAKVSINIMSDVAAKHTDQSVGHQRHHTTPHVYGKAMLVVAFDSSMWIITIP